MTGERALRAVVGCLLAVVCGRTFGSETEAGLTDNIFSRGARRAVVGCRLSVVGVLELGRCRLSVFQCSDNRSRTTSSPAERGALRAVVGGLLSEFWNLNVVDCLFFSVQTTDNRSRTTSSPARGAVVSHSAQIAPSLKVPDGCQKLTGLHNPKLRIMGS
jgi:hypothetical protein